MIRRWVMPFVGSGRRHYWPAEFSTRRDQESEGLKRSFSEADQLEMERLEDLVEHVCHELLAPFLIE